MDLTLVQLSQAALTAGMDLGFNAVEVERWIDPESFEAKLVLRFGDYEQFRKPRLRTPCEWALSYSQEVGCIREPRQVEVPIALLERPVATVRAYFVEQLLEVCGWTAA
jgi:hypothetical protein